MMAKVTCFGLGSGSPPYLKDVPTVQIYPNMTTQGVEVLIPLEAYTRLVNWASMGRTLGGVIRALEECGAEWETIAELSDVRSALDECHQAVRRHWANLKQEEGNRAMRQWQIGTAEPRDVVGSRAYRGDRGLQGALEECAERSRSRSVREAWVRESLPVGLGPVLARFRGGALAPETDLDKFCYAVCAELTEMAGVGVPAGEAALLRALDRASMAGLEDMKVGECASLILELESHA